jgi:hypothetical protein
MESSGSLSVDACVYRSRFARWDERASVRTAPLRRLQPDGADGLLYFPPEMAPMVAHPLVSKLGADALSRALAHHLAAHLDFTARLEHQVVNPVCVELSQAAFGLDVPCSMQQDAYNIYTDEAWHAQFSATMQRQVEAVAQLDRGGLGRAALLDRLAEVGARAPDAVRPLIPLFSAIVSETVISAILATIPSDQRIVPSVRELIRDHAVDEGTHHAYFADLLRQAWPQLSVGERRGIGMCLPPIIRAFLEPDLCAHAAILAQLGLCEDDAGQVLSDCYERDAVAAVVCRASRATRHHLMAVGALEDPATHEAFDAAGLLPPELER